MHVNTQPGEPAGIIVRALVLIVMLAAGVAWILGIGGCAYLPRPITTAAAYGCAGMIERAASECGDPIDAACAARVWNVSERDAASLLRAAARVVDDPEVDPDG